MGFEGFSRTSHAWSERWRLKRAGSTDKVLVVDPFYPCKGAEGIHSSGLERCRSCYCDFFLFAGWNDVTDY